MKILLSLVVVVLLSGCAARKSLTTQQLAVIQPPARGEKVTDHPLQLALGFLPRPNDGIVLHQTFTNGPFSQRVFLWAEFPAGTMYTVSMSKNLGDWFAPPQQVITETNVTASLPYDKTGQAFFKLVRRK